MTFIDSHSTINLEHLQYSHNATQYYGIAELIVVYCAA